VLRLLLLRTRELGKCIEVGVAGAECE
jgi:hypothetical protein